MHITAAHKRAISQYYSDLEIYKNHQAVSELNIRPAFQNLLHVFANSVGWTLISEWTLPNGKRPDGTFRDSSTLYRGYWEAKDTRDDLAVEIRKKIAAGYPLTNIIFEDSRHIILYQNKKQVMDVAMTDRDALGDLLKQFFSYTEPDIAQFNAAMQEFKDRIPELAQSLLETIKDEHAKNGRFVRAFAAFMDLCHTSLDPNMSSATIDEMLVQHLLTERLFRTIFNNPDFTRRNVIAAEIEKVIDTLTSRAFNRADFLRKLDRFYIAIEEAAKSLDGWTEKQHFLDTVYERFFQGYSVQQADTHGIVYTPQEIVDFMCASVEEMLEREFSTSISAKGVQILDPCTGTGNFIVNLLRRIDGKTLPYKYANDLFCNEIMLLPYYIASLNIEHAYYERTGDYQPFEGICFTDTLELAESRQLPLFVEENTERVKREKEAQIMVVIGNPPYNAWQKSENDNNKNRRYPVIEKRVRETYAKDSKATLKNALSDAYVKFFRWAVDRLQGHDGIVCYVSNNSFVDQIAFDGMRKHLLQDFTEIYHLDLHGNVRQNPKLSGTTHNVFGIQVGVGITIAIRNSEHSTRTVNYYRVPEFWRKTEKLAFLTRKDSISEVDWQELEPDEKQTWRTEGMHSEFATFLAVGTKEAKSSTALEAYTIFKKYSRGVITCRDNWAYDFNSAALAEKMSRFIDTYNGEVDRWRRYDNAPGTVDSFVIYDDKKIKWSGDLKVELTRGKYASYSEKSIRHSLYRPFTKQNLYFDSLLNNSIYLQPIFFPTPTTEAENTVIWLKVGSEWPMFALATNVIPDLLPQGGSQCFPYYTYSSDGTNRRENITDWALAQFQQQYGSEVSKRDIFAYVYAMLHHPQYRERYAENLKRELPRIPLLRTKEAFETCVRIGTGLMDLHLTYENAEEYPLKWIENREVPVNWRVEKMKLTPDKCAVIVNEWLTLSGVPQEAFRYRLGNRAALEWVIDQYRVTTDARSGITSDPNSLEDEEYIVRLVGRVVEVSVETVKLVDELMENVKQEEWVETALE